MYARNGDRLTPLMILLESFPEKAVPFIHLMHVKNVPLTVFMPNGYSLLNAVWKKYLNAEDVPAKNALLDTLTCLLDCDARPQVRDATRLNTVSHCLDELARKGSSPLLNTILAKGIKVSWADLYDLLKVNRYDLQSSEKLICKVLENNLLEVDDSEFCLLVQKRFFKEEYAASYSFLNFYKLFNLCPPYIDEFPSLDCPEKIENKITEYFKDYSEYDTFTRFKISKNSDNKLSIFYELIVNGSATECVFPLSYNKHDIDQILHHLFIYSFNRAQNLDNILGKDVFSPVGLRVRREKAHIIYEARSMNNSFFTKIWNVSLNLNKPHEWGLELSKTFNDLKQDHATKLLFQKPVHKQEPLSLRYIQHQQNQITCNSDGIYNYVIEYTPTNSYLFVYGLASNELTHNMLHTCFETCKLYEFYNKNKNSFDKIYTLEYEGPLRKLPSANLEFVKMSEKQMISNYEYISSNEIKKRINSTTNYKHLSALFPDIKELEKIIGCVKYSHVDPDTQTLSMHITFNDFKGCKEITFDIHGTSFWRVEERLVFFLNWKNKCKLINQPTLQELSLDEEAYKLIENPSIEITWRDPDALVEFNQLLTIYDRNQQLFKDIKREDLCRLVDILNNRIANIEGRMGPAGEVLFFQSQVMAKHIILALPNLSENIQLTIFSELARIAGWCMPEIRKGFYDVMTRWIVAQPEQTLPENATRLIATAIDFAKRQAFYSLVNSGNAYKHGPANTHLYTYVANCISKNEKMNLPHDILTHKTEFDGLTTAASDALGSPQQVATKYALLLEIYLGYALAHKFEQTSIESSDASKKMIDLFNKDLLELAVEQSNTYVITDSSEKEKQLLELNHQLDLLNKKLNKLIIQKTHAFCEYQELEKSLKYLNLQETMSAHSVGRKRKQRDEENENLFISRRKIDEEEEILIERTSVSLLERIKFRLEILKNELAEIYSLQAEHKTLSENISNLQEEIEKQIKEHKYQILENSRWTTYDFELKDLALGYKGIPKSLEPLPHAFPSVTLSLSGIINVLEKFRVIRFPNFINSNNIINNSMITD
jgi:hypothetical protein